MVSRSFVFVVTLVAAQSCVVDVGAPTDAHIRVVTDIARSDTINAEPSSQMVIEILGAKGRLDHDVAVTLSGLPSPIEGQDLTMHPFDVEYGTAGSTTPTTSDRVAFRVRFGNRAGPAGILISVPELDLVDTLSFTVKPGAPALIRLKPGDTAITVGGSYTQDGLVLDQGGNDLGLRPVFSSSDPALTVAATGKVDGTTFGRAGVSVSYAVGGQLIRETAMVSVVPAGEIALGVAAPGAAATSAIGIRHTDGTAVKTYPTPQSPFETTWSADGLRVYYAGESAGGSTQRLYALTVADGSIETIVPDADPALNGRRLVWPAPSRDGAWVYFTVLESGPWSSVWRVHPDGSGVEELVSDAPPPGDFRIRNSPSPSPDGTRLAYTEKSYTANDVKILDLTSGAITTITGTGADEVRWSPTGERLATRGGAGLYVVNPDGSGLRQVIPDISTFGGLDWSGDGQWIIVKIQTIPNIVNPDTGLFLPVPLAGGAGLAWNPK